ncbi:MAG: NAD(P)/FAD-dependent oxidoreductase [Clostridia bacterium]|nr:NAD(P)/FAD-dependent oxidoreductase [Clostridia bacterium]
MKKKLVIIGGGPAGLAAAIKANDTGLAPDDILIIERDRELGGILNQCIHAGFGLHTFGEELTGPEYSGRFIDDVIARGISYTTDSMVLSLTKDRKVTFVSPEYGYTTVEADAVIIATGCRERTRGALNIPGTRPAGVFTAGCAQRYVNIEGYMPGRRVVILGSGDIGLIMARRMTLEGAKVERVCEVMPYSGGLARNIAQCLDDFGIPLFLSQTVIKIHGKERVEGVTVANVDENRRPIKGTEEFIECDTLLLSVGLIPENEIASGAEIALDRVTGGAVVDQNNETSTDGIYACGNALHVHDLVDFVTKEAYMAGESAAKRVIEGKKEAERTVPVKACASVRYTVPQKITVSGGLDALKFYFRVGETLKKPVFEVRANGEVIKSVKKQIAAPGEMESITLNADECRKIEKADLIEICNL